MVSLKALYPANYGYGTSELVFRDIVNALTVYGYLTAVNGINLVRRFTMVVLPEPVAPTMAIF